ncbi:alpha/beta hydrolase [Bifidobacterium catulorum]|uniref:Alpha/beta hydrolase n=1 Tax=Bifidobacterium catulorum TaxID=1630173 RepID=A0A2U2MS29_9BIFI|nr:alpha/beta hydrolase [Bifidobacterium catulorum]PWG59639.1 alpha/beta hydrolase [Bifidobacterium catulorum]
MNHRNEEATTFSVNGIAFTREDLYATDGRRRLTPLQERLARTWTYLDEDIPADDDMPDDAEYRDFVEYIRRHRASYAFSDVRRLDFRSAVPGTVMKFADIDYAGDGTRSHLLDIFLPKEAYLRGDGDIPVIFNIHGGAFFYSFKEIQNAYAAQLAEHGFAVVCPNYTLAPGGDFLDMLADVSTALQWLMHNGAAWQLSSEQMYLVSDSAGALLGTFLLACETNREMASLLGVPGRGARFRSVGFTSGMLAYDHLFDPSYPDSGELFEKLRPLFRPLIGRLGGTPYERTAALMERIDYPPVWLSTSTDDFLESDSLITAMRLRAMDRDHELHDLRAVNGRRIPHDYPLMTWDSGSAALNDAMIAFFREHLSPRTTLTASV